MNYCYLLFVAVVITVRSGTMETVLVSPSKMQNISSNSFVILVEVSCLSVKVGILARCLRFLTCPSYTAKVLTFMDISSGNLVIKYLKTMAMSQQVYLYYGYS